MPDKFIEVFVAATLAVMVGIGEVDGCVSGAIIAIAEVARQSGNIFEFDEWISTILR